MGLLYVNVMLSDSVEEALLSVTLPVPSLEHELD